jgi:protoheme IX farnesyltransferase
MAGFLILLAGANALAAGLALGTLLIYVLVYTPMKPRSSLNTLVGAVTGALPPVVGWTAAGRGLDWGACLLFALLFLWQMPHFLALAWLYREDYARGGFRMISTEDPSGRLTGFLVVIYSLALLPLAFALPLAGMAGPLFSAGFLALGGMLLVLGLGLRRRRDARSARRLFLASVIQLPLILGLLVLDPTTRDAGVSPALEAVAASDAERGTP